jgi:HlyD family secretion protein
MTLNLLHLWNAPVTKPRRTIWLGGALLLALLATVGVRTLRPALEVEVTTAPVGVGRIVRHVVATGTLQAVTTVQVGSQVSGTIQSLDADYNSIVHQGQVIARLDPALFDAAVGQARARLLERQAALAQARAEKMGSETAVEDARMKLVRAEELAVKLLIPPSDLDLARVAMQEATADQQGSVSRVAEAAAAVDQAAAALDQAKVDLDHTQIVSPIDGIVVARNVDVGQTVASTLQAPVLFNIATDLRHMQLEVFIDESDVGGVQAGEPAVFEVESYPDERFSGTVSQVRLQPVAEQTTTATPVSPSLGAPAASDVPTVISYPTMVEVQNPDERLRPGMTATVTLTGFQRDHVLRVPNAALSFRPPTDVVVALGEKTTAVAATADSPAAEDVHRVWKYDGKRFTSIDVLTGLSDGKWTELVGNELRSGDLLATAARLGRK